MNKKGKLVIYMRGGVPGVVLDAAQDAVWAAFSSSSPRIKTFTADLLKTTDVSYGGFSNQLTKFYGKLPVLSTAASLFYGCSLDAKSIKIILTSIPKYTSGTHAISIGRRTNWLNDQEIAKMLGTTTPIAAGTYHCYEINADGSVGDDKGWTVTVQ